MYPTVMEVWQHAPAGWSFVAAVTASILTILAWRGPSYVAAWSAHVIGMREQNRLDLQAGLRPEMSTQAPANDATGAEPVLRFPSRAAPRLVTAPEEEEAA